MAELNLPMNRSASRRIGSAAINAPRILMSWEDWLTFVAVLVTFLSVAVSIQGAHWVDGMPAMAPTAVAGLLIGLFAARIRLPSALLHPLGMVLGAGVVIMAAQSYADGITLSDRLADFRLRMEEWYNVVRAGDISNDNLPFVTLVHAITFLGAYLASWSTYRWHNAWFAIVPGGFILLANISFLRGQPSGAFVVFLFGAMALIARAYLQNNQARWKREGVDYPDFISLGAAQLTVVLTTALIVAAWMMPLGKELRAVDRVLGAVIEPFDGQSESLVRLFHNVDSRKGSNLHNFGATLPIQGDVKLGTKVLFEINAGQPGLVRATSYDEYTGNGWKATDRDTRKVDGQELPELASEELYRKRTVTILRVLAQSGESTLLSPGSPIATNVDAYFETPEGVPNDVERMRSRRGIEKGDTYNVIGSESIAAAEELRGAGNDYPQWVIDRYLQLPDSLPSRVRDEALRIAGNSATPYDRVKALEQFLRTFPYDLAVDSAPPKRDAVDFFLFDLKRGYFDYQASVLAVMLRTIGIPSRVAVGFVLDPAEAEETKYIVRKDDAYTWVEVFFPNYGWVSFNPTQDKPEGGAGGVGAGFGAELPFEVPSLEELFGSEEDIFENPEAGDIEDALSEEAVSHRRVPWFVLATLAAVLAVVALALLSAGTAWNWGLGGLDSRARLWAKVHRLAGWTGLAGSRAETPREWSRRVGGSLGVEDEAVRLGRAYEEARYGRPGQQQIGDDDARGSYRTLRNALAAKLFRYRRTGPATPGRKKK